MMIYSWPWKILYDLEMSINYFIWMGKVRKRGCVTYNWNTTRKPVDETGLGSMPRGV